MKKLLALLLALVLLCGCSAETAADASAYAPAEEERLTIFTCLDETVYASIVREFEERTGIWVTVETGSAPELMDRIARAEDCDLLLGCEADFLEANGELFQPYRAQAAYSDWCSEGSCWTPLSLRPLVILYNTKLVRRNLPTGWDCLLGDAWQGEIAFADPAKSDVSRTVLRALTLQYPGQTPEETLAAFACNLETLLESTAEAADQVADGRYCLGIVPEDEALRRIADGAELAIVYPEKGTYLITDCGAIPAGCAHPENAKAFLDFVLSTDAQSHARTAWGRGSVLAELAQLPETPRFYDAAEAAQAQGGLIEAWNALWEVEP